VKIEKREEPESKSNGTHFNFITLKIKDFFQGTPTEWEA
jgi:hypothetical protein